MINSGDILFALTLKMWYTIQNTLKGERLLSTSVFLISANINTLGTLTELLSNTHYSLLGTATDPDEARAKLHYLEADLIIIYTPFAQEFGDQLAKDLSYIRNTAGLIVITKEEKVHLMAQRLANCPAFVLNKPVNKQFLLQTMAFMEKSLSLLAIEKKKNSQLEKKIDDLKLINRAKHLLIQSLGMTEHQAHSHIQKQAMDMRLSPREVAENILKTYEF